MTTYNRASDISDDIATRLQAILLANQCETNIGRDVKRGKRKLPGDDEPPCIQLYEGGDDPTDQAGSMPSVKIEQDYVISAFDQCDPDNPNDQAHKMIRDIKRAIFKTDSTLGNTVKLVRYLGRDIGPRPDGVALVQVQVMIRVSYVEDLRNP